MKNNAINFLFVLMHTPHASPQSPSMLRNGSTLFNKTSHQASEASFLYVYRD